MASNAAPFHFRRRTIGRAASPPTWACYEQIPYDDDDCSDSNSDSCSEDDEEYGHSLAVNEHHHHHHDGGSDSEDTENGGETDAIGSNPPQDTAVDKDDSLDDGAPANVEPPTKDIKGKQRAVDPPPPEPTKRQHRKKQRKTPFTLRPILTIQRSQGFVWNQDLFVPPYIKDRYVASTSPPNRAFNSCGGFGDNYSELEVVEIRVQEGELDDIIP